MRRLVLLLLLLLGGSAWGQNTNVNPPVGSVWTYLGATYGAGWTLGSPTTGGVVNVVTNFGADATCGTDAAPAFRSMAAVASSKYLLVPPGCYLFSSTVPSGLPAINPANVRFTNQHDFVLDMRGAQFKTSDAASFSGMIQIDGGTRFEVLGGNFIGNHNGYTAGQESCALVPYNVTNFRFVGQSFGGNWGGEGAAYCGDWMVNGVFRDQWITNAGQCFDVAFLKNVTLDNIHGYGIGAGGATGFGDKCVSIIYDTPSVGNNSTGYSFTENDGVTVTNSSAENFGAGWFVSSGGNFTFSGNLWERNNNGGGYIYYGGPGSFSSAGHPPHNIVVTGDRYFTNGSSTSSAGYGIFVDVSQITNADQIDSLVVSGTLFQNNWLAAIDSSSSPGTKIANLALTPTCTRSIAIGGTGCIGANIGGLTRPAPTVTDPSIDSLVTMGGVYNTYGSTVTGNLVSYESTGFGPGTGPVVPGGASDCGTAPALTGSNVVGQIVVGSGANGGKCSMHFSASWVNSPFCFANSNIAARPVHVQSISTTNLTIEGLSTLNAGDILTYLCRGWQ